MKRTTALTTAAGLLGGFLVSRVTKVRALGGLVSSLAGAKAGRQWAKESPVTATALGSIYTGAFALSRPLAKKIGAWPSALALSAGTAAAAYLLHDRKV